MKGSMLDLLIMLPVVAFLGLIIVVGASTITQIANDITANPAFVDTPDRNYTKTFADGQSGYTALSNMFPFVVIAGLGLITVVLAISIRTNSAFAVFSLLLFMIILLIASFVGNAYEAFGASEFASEKATEFTAVTWVFQNLAIILLGLFVLVMVALYGKGSGGL